MGSDQSKTQNNSEQKKYSSDSTQTSISKKTESVTPEFEGSLINQIVTRFSDKLVQVIYVRPGRAKILVPPNEIVQVASFIKDRLGFDHAESVSGTDYPNDNQIEVIYHLSSYSDDKLSSQILALSTRVDRNESRMPTLINIFKSAEYHERETFEMLGVYFEGHPRNERFLLPEDWADIPPLRKEFRIKGR
ncbi:MAG: NADH-quinone oxidoreductase subunit C [Nitrososphaeraceae archaeon]